MAACNDNSMRRAKVYRLNEDGKWDDQGTGHVTVDYFESCGKWSLLVTDEEDNKKTLLLHCISTDDIYQKQEDSRILWRDSEISTELALSFQESAGCLYTWDHICNVQRDLRYSIDPDWLIHEKIISAFSKLEICLYDGLIQFWAPVKTGGKHLLTTSNQPFAVGDPTDKDIARYRLCSMKYQYNIDVNNVKEDPTIIHASPAATAFRNQMPKQIMDLTVHEKTPLVSSALECGLTEAFLLPVFFPSQSCCVGIVECVPYSFNVHTLAVKDFNKAFEEVGFKTFEHLKNKTICTLKHTKDEIDGALKIISATQRIDFVQVWIAYEDGKFMTSSSSLEEIQTKPVAVIKLSSHVFETFDDSLNFFYQCHSDRCDLWPLKRGEELVGKTLQTYEPYFIKDILDGSNELVELMSNFDFDTRCSCFVLSLRSTETSDLVYALEFFTHESQNHVMLLESLVLTLKRCLPSFKYASGGELGDELSIVENATESETRTFKIFQESKLSLVPKAPEKGKRLVVEQCLARNMSNWKTAPIPLLREDIEPQFGKTMKEAAESLNVSLSTLKRKCKGLGISEWHGKEHSKRKVNESYSYQSNTNKDGRIQDLLASNEGETNLDVNTLTIKAEFVDDTIRFDIPMSSATLAAIQKEIEEGFKLNHEDYKLKYLDEDGDWILITSEKSMDGCIKSQKNLASTTIRLRLFSRQI